MTFPARLGPIVLGALLLASCAAPNPRAFSPGSAQQAAAPPAAATTSSARGAGEVTTGSNGSVVAAATSTATSATSGNRARQARSTTQAATATAASTAEGTSASPAADAAIKAVIQRANDEQQQAFAQHDPTVMRDTATTEYYDQLAQTERDMEQAGVSAIKLLKLEWGAVSVQGAGAQATTFETWQTTLSDGSTEQDRERNVYSLVEQGSAWKVQADDHPDANLDQPSGNGSGNPSPAVPSPRVIPSAPGAPSTVPAPRPAGAAGLGQSRNWSGYAATGGTFTAVSGTWTVPQVTSDGSLASDATWVGIGGVEARDLIQAGTDATVLGSRVRYTAWVETLPQVSHTVPLTVSPGDTVSVSLSQQQDGTWLIAFDDKTSGQTYQTTQTYDSSRSSAEWVEEAPAGGRRVLPLDDFGTVQFSGGSTVKDGKQETLAQAGAKPVTMIDRAGQPIARPSALGNDGASFSVSRLADTGAGSPSTGSGQPGFGTGGSGFGQPPAGSSGSSGRGGSGRRSSGGA